MTITPLGIPAVWAAVMDAAGHRCQCTGACGGHYAHLQLQCDEHAETTQLLAAPADLTLSIVAAAALPTGELLAWCVVCHRRAGSRQRAAARQDQPEPDSLF